MVARQRTFEMPIDNFTATLSINTRGDPTTVVVSTSPAGLQTHLAPKEPTETLGPADGLTPPDCQK